MCCVERIGVVAGEAATYPVDPFLMLAEEPIEGALVTSLGGADQAGILGIWSDAETLVRRGRWSTLGLHHEREADDSWAAMGTDHGADHFDSGGVDVGDLAEHGNEVFDVGRLAVHDCEIFDLAELCLLYTSPSPRD